ncbi:MAG: lactate utilization protein [Anaeromicrobium sp.]|jgi:L-lactate utilization protein LutB|uniref:lactate utilization protein n=1 Tax=Anaeromicrobium sp. TaxID=1929132 RepID=UPI0025D0B390|nr:lactate utilization protein [Anaeromicrobium sp.]MCT4595192.1 lactate utilization protein [Anaeromicrobium sp.]
MDKNAKWVVEKRIDRTIEALKKNNMNGYHARRKEDVVGIIRNLINKGDTVSVGGSVSLAECGVVEFLRNGDYNFLDRYKEGLTPAHIKDIYRKSFCADGYFTSTNAITEEGYLYNVDGRGNRVAAMIYGPDKVIVVAGVNKIVKDVKEAIGRNERIAAPANTKRLDRKTPCKELGYCVECSSPERICSDYVLIKKQMDKDRIHVILVEESLGY